MTSHPRSLPRRPFVPSVGCRPQSVGEEIANSITHGLGALLGLVALVAMVWVAVSQRRSPVLVASLAIYGTSLFMLYMASTLYHALTHHGGKRVFQVLDHSGIYLLIAGTYTPFTLVGMRGWPGVALFAAEWAIAIAGISLEAVWRRRPRWVGAVVFIAMGWLAVFAIGPMVAALPPLGLGLLIAGGVAYTAGTVFYAMRNVPYMHAVWHLWVLAGSALHFVAIVAFIVPKG